MPGADVAERNLFFRFLCLLLDFVPDQLLMPLCRHLWDAKYPDCLWTNDVAIGNIFENGSLVEDDYRLPGDVVTGSVTKKNKGVDIVWTETLSLHQISKPNFRKVTQFVSAASTSSS